jgi:hypothetical protein
MKGAADDRFLRAWAIVAFDCFLAPTTGLKVSPRCYPAVYDTKLLPQTNICQFVADQIRVAFSALGNKKSVCCCVFHLVVSVFFSYDEHNTENSIYEGNYCLHSNILVASF